jgi:23S rRNA G2445 N2-methylase RlmL
MDSPPDLPLFISLLKDTAVLYRDLGGGSLHRRGYRGDGAMHKAALNEAAAAGLLLLAGWDEHAAAGGEPLSRYKKPLVLLGIMISRCSGADGSVQTNPI